MKVVFNTLAEVTKVALLFILAMIPDGIAQEVKRPNELNPSEQWHYQVPLKEALNQSFTSGICKIDDFYHMFMSVGITYKTKDRKQWYRYHAIPYEVIEDSKGTVGAEQPDCGKQPYFVSRDWGLYFWNGNGWDKRGEKPPKQLFDRLITGDRQVMYLNRHDDGDFLISSENGWWESKDLKNRKNYYLDYFDREFGFVGSDRKADIDSTTPVHFKNRLKTSITGVNPGISSGLMLNNQFYMVWRKGVHKNFRFKAFKVTDLKGVEVDLTSLNLPKAGPYHCYNARKDLSVCRYNDGYVFFAQTPSGIGGAYIQVKITKDLGGGRYRYVSDGKFRNCLMGVDAVYCDESQGNHLFDGLPYWVGTVDEYKYDDIVKRIQDDYYAHRKQIQ